MTLKILDLFFLFACLLPIVASVFGEISFLEFCDGSSSSCCRRFAMEMFMSIIYYRVSTASNSRSLARLCGFSHLRACRTSTLVPTADHWSIKSTDQQQCNAEIVKETEPRNERAKLLCGPTSEWILFCSSKTAIWTWKKRNSKL